MQQDYVAGREGRRGSKLEATRIVQARKHNGDWQKMQFSRLRCGSLTMFIDEGRNLVKD